MKKDKMSVNKFRLHRVNVNQKNEILKICEKQRVKSTKIEESSVNYFKRLCALILCSSKCLYQMSIRYFATYIQ